MGQGGGKFYHEKKKKGDTDKVFPVLKEGGGGSKCLRSFNVGAWRFIFVEGGGRNKFPHFTRGRGYNKF